MGAGQTIVRKATFVLVMAWLMLGCFEAAVARTPGFLGRQNTQIVNDGGVVLLRGVNLGNWLYNESYMTGAPFDNDTWPAGLKDVLGTEANVATFYATWRSNYITQADIQRIRGFGFNCVRVPLDWKLFYDTNTAQLTTNAFVYLDNLLTWCTASGVYVIPDMHGTPGGQRDPGTLFFDPTNQTILSNIWRHVAARYSTNRWLGGYDLVNEPLVGTASEKWRVRDLYVRLTVAIRSVDPNHLIFAEGNYYGGDLYDLDPRWDENMAFGIHDYWTPVPSTGPFGIANQVGLANTANVPLWLGEFGENSNPWINAEKRSVEAYGVGWVVWPYKICGERIQSVAWAPFTSGYQTVQNYWNGTGAKPSQTAALSALIDMAQRTALSFCQENKDFVDALMRPNFHTATIPFALNTIPGRIYASDYDMGGAGVAYNDTVFQATDSTIPPWNNGWHHRNDGVDLDVLNDNGLRHYVGWTETNEWLSFTVISSAGTPAITIRYSSPTTNRIRIELDGQHITGSISLPATGGWFNWTNATSVANTNLATGIHAVKVVFETGGMNLYWIDFAGLPPVAPAPWTNLEIGAPTRPGYAFFDAGSSIWTVAGGGADIFGSSDQGNFAVRNFVGDGTLVARVSGLQNGDPSAKAGVMFRASGASNAMYAFVFVTPQSVGFDCRTNTGGLALRIASRAGGPPVWLKLTRTGNIFAGATSDNGVDWTDLGSPQTIPMGITALAALAVTAHNDALLATATFDNVFPATPVSLVTTGAVWRYNDTGANLGAAWRSNNFDDASWPRGPAMLGYGDANGTLPRTTNSFGPNPNNRYITTYYRCQFVSPDPANFAQLSLRLQRDDGAIVYLNGAEIFRSNMPTGAVDYLTLAPANVSGIDETIFYLGNVSPARLLNGLNVLAAEVHQFTNASTDLAFDLALAGSPAAAIPNLSGTLATNRVRLAWPGWANGFTLWSAPNLHPPVNWLPVAGAILSGSDGYSMTLPVSGTSARFFRVQSP